MSVSVYGLTASIVPNFYASEKPEEQRGWLLRNCSRQPHEAATPPRRHDVLRYVDGALDGALDGADRTSKLTHRLLAFPRQQPLSPVPLDPKAVRVMSVLLHRALGEKIEAETVPGRAFGAHVSTRRNSRASF